MTVTAAMIEDAAEGNARRAWIGADSMVSYGDLKLTTDAKVFEVAGVLAAISGCMRGKDIVERALHREIDPYLSVEKLVERLDRDMWTPGDRDGSPPWRDFSVILTDGRVIVEIEPTLGVYWYREPGRMVAQGIGCEMAQAADFAARVSGRTPYERVRISLDAACTLHKHCAGPPVVRTIEATAHGVIRP